MQIPGLQPNVKNKFWGKHLQTVAQIDLTASGVSSKPKKPFP